MIVYTVDFSKSNELRENLKIQTDNKKDDKPAEIIKLENNIVPYLQKACELFNQGILFQSAYYFNLAYDIDKKNSQSVLQEVFILGLINFKLGNFGLAQKYFLKSLGVTPYFLVNDQRIFMLYRNCLMLKNFKLATKLKNILLKSCGENKNGLIKNLFMLSVVKADNQKVFDSTFSFSNLFLSCIETMRCKNYAKEAQSNSFFEMLRIIDPENPYIYQIEKDLDANIRRTYAKKLSKNLISLRLKEIDSFIKQNNKIISSFKNSNSETSDAFSYVEKLNADARLKGVVRFLSECCDFDTFKKYLNSLTKNVAFVPKYLKWQIQDALFSSLSDKYKIILFEKFCELDPVTNNTTLFYKDLILNIQNISYISYLYKLSPKSATSFCEAMFMFFNDVYKKTAEFKLDVFLPYIIDKRIINKETKEFRDGIKINNLSAENIKLSFLIAFYECNEIPLPKKLQEKKDGLKQTIKALNINYFDTRKVKNKQNIVVLDF